MIDNKDFKRARATLSAGETYRIPGGGVITQEDVLQLMADCAMSKHEAIKRLAEYAATHEGE